MSHLFLEHGLIHQTSCPHTPEQNGRAERTHRHIIETTLALLYQAHLPTEFWMEALLTSVYLINRLPHSAIQFRIPYTVLFHASPDYAFLIPFGCLCYPWLKPYPPHKLSPKSTPCVFLGYCPTTKGYRCYDPICQKVHTSRHVKFVESEFPYPNLIHLSSSSVSHYSSKSSPFFDITLASEDSVPLSIPTVPISTTIPIPSSNVSSSSSSLSSNVTLPVTVPVSSSSVPAPLPTSIPSSHPMLTRSKHGIFKPTVPFSLSLTTSPTNNSFSVSSEPTEPKSFS